MHRITNGLEKRDKIDCEPDLKNHLKISLNQFDILQKLGENFNENFNEISKISPGTTVNHVKSPFAPLFY